jgi:hypothetical protein
MKILSNVSQKVIKLWFFSKTYRMSNKVIDGNLRAREAQNGMHIKVESEDSVHLLFDFHGNFLSGFNSSETHL